MVTDIHLCHIETDDALAACFPVMRLLRPGLSGPGEFIASVRRMENDRYRILAACRGDVPLALAGYRLQENLIYGRFLYVDDLVTAEASRGQHLGARLLAELSDLAVREGCRKLVLDTGLSNALAQRFYFRQGLLTGAMRFSKVLEEKRG
jgi:ribosomal protein S18 acetylase RimI-like enzyme